LVAAGYATDALQYMGPYSADAVRLLELAPESHVLDVACGCGTATLQLAERGHRVTAVDFSPGMIEQLRAAAERRAFDRVDTRVMDGQALDLPDGRFDGALSMFGLMFFPDRARGFAELRRTLRPGARAAVSCWCPADRSPAMQLMFGALRAAVPEMPDRKPVDPLNSPEGLLREMTAAGFRDVEVHAVSHGWSYASATAAWEAACRGGVPFAMAAKALGPEEWSRRTPTAIAFFEANATFPCAPEAPAFIGVGVA